MMKNIEIKAHAGDLSAVRDRLAQQGLRPAARLHQVDTYFDAPRGRLKLREINGTEAQLIHYDRLDQAKPRASDYVYVDWGPDFAAQHGLAFPELSNAAVKAGLGPLGREYLLAAGGTGYFRLDVVRAHLESGRLRRVPDMPEFLYPAYAVYAADCDLAFGKSKRDSVPPPAPVGGQITEAAAQSPATQFVAADLPGQTALPAAGYGLEALKVR